MSFYLLFSLCLETYLIDLKEDSNHFPLHQEEKKIENLNKLSFSLLKGGIPAAPSGTATLLRLSPSR